MLVLFFCLLSSWELSWSSSALLVKMVLCEHAALTQHGFMDDKAIADIVQEHQRAVEEEFGPDNFIIVLRGLMEERSIFREQRRGVENSVVGISQNSPSPSKPENQDFRVLTSMVRSVEVHDPMWF